MVSIQHPLLRADAVQFRGYQANLARIAGQRDTLVVLPTGMGKTIVALLVIADAWKQGARRILVMAPTRPLVEQHARFFEENLNWDGDVHALTGNVPPGKRELAYKSEGIVVATPQVVHNDLLADRVPGPDWVVYDECHRAVGDYPYTFIGAALQRSPHRALGLTASPGHDIAKIEEVRRALGLEHVEIRTPADPDVAEYVQDVEMEWETLPLPPTMDRVTRLLEEAMAERIKALKAIGVLKLSKPNKRVLLDIAKQAQRAIKSTSDPDPSWFQALTLQAQALKIHHAMEQCQTQGAAAFVAYLEQMRKEANGPKSSKANRAVVDDHRVNQAYQIARHDDAENPKMGRVETLVQQQLAKGGESKVIVFTHYRTTCEQVTARLSGITGVRPVVFVGQGKRKGQDGLTQKQQGEILDKFRTGEFNVLVATSVAEEGLDIPATDLVVFYEPIPSEIRSIQRRGRTGRQSEGRVVVLMTKGTADEAAHWSARRKEQSMVKELLALRARLGGEGPTGGQQLLVQAKPTTPPPPTTDAPVIICDSREQAGGVMKHLHGMGVQLQVRSLEIADFILSDRVAIERKTSEDFVDSLVDGRLFEQMKKLKEYPRPYIILEGDGLASGRSVSPEAIMGAVASVTIDYGIPILQTQDALETARFLVAVAKREQRRNGRHLAIRGTSSTNGDDDVVIDVLAALPGISELRAKALLGALGSLEAVLQADEATLAAVEGIGPKTAARIREVIEHRYEG